MEKKLLFAMVALAVFAGAALAQDTVWTRRYSARGDMGYGVALSRQGYLYVAGQDTNGAIQSLLTIRYTTAGDTVWSRKLSTSIIGGARAVAVDASGNAYVAGWGFNGYNVDYQVVVYNTAGDTLWTKGWDGGSQDLATAVAVDGSNTLITGQSFQVTNYVWMTMKLDRWGDTVWARRFNNGHDSYSSGVAVDGSGNVYIAGYTSNGSNSDIVVFKRGPTGDSLWARRLDLGGNEYAYGIAVGPGGTLYVSGAAGSPSACLTMKYNATTGDTIWTRSSMYGRNNWGYGVAVDQAGNAFVASTAANRNNNDYYTIKYGSNGDSLWASDMYDSGREDVERAVAVDTSGNVYVTGYSNNGTRNDVLTIKYHPTGTGVYEQEVLAPSRAGAGLRVTPNPARTACAIRLDQPVAGLAVYDFAGRLVRKFDSPATSLAWDLRDGQGRRLENGVYLVRTESNRGAETRRVVVLR
jgi:hypothetical protein